MKDVHLKVGDMIEVEQAWEDETGNYHEEIAEVVSIDSDGYMKLKFDEPEITDFLDGAGYKEEDYRNYKTN